jgi:hypothetical protein
MERNKTGVIVLVLLAGFFIIAIAMVFNTSVRRESVLKHQASVNEKIEFLNSIDLTVYWIGGFPSELEKLRESTNVIMPEEISNDNMPIRSSTFHITVTEESGKKEEIVPRKYSEYMLIVITTGEGFSDEAKEVLRDCIVYNGVPVLCIGGDACEMVGTLLIHGSGYAKDHTFFYKLNDGYKDSYIEAKAVSAGGVDLADAFCTKLCEYCNISATKKMTEASERIASAASSAEEAATATTADTDPSETVTETTSKYDKLLRPPA